MLLSLVQTCRALSINPRDYLESIMRQFLEHPMNRLEELLPDRWAKEQESRITKPPKRPLHIR